MKQWTQNIEATQVGEKNFTVRFAKAQHIPKETAQLFATAKISYEDLQQVMDASAARFVQATSSDSALYHKRWPDLFPAKGGDLSAQQAQKTLSAWLVKQVAARARFSMKTLNDTTLHQHPMDFSWGQLYALGGNLAHDETVGKHIHETILSLELYGAGESLSEQQQLGTLLALQGIEIKSRLGRHKGLIVAPVEQSGQGEVGAPSSEVIFLSPPTAENQESITTRKVRSRLSELLGEADDLHSPGVAKAYEQAVHETGQLLRICRTKTLTDSETGEVRKRLAKIDQELKETIKRDRQPAQPFPKNLFMPKARASERTPPLLLEGSETALVKDEVTSGLYASLEPPAPNSRLNCLRSASTLANELSFMNHASRYDSYVQAFKKNPVRADNIPVGKRAFLASRIIEGHRVHELVGPQSVDGAMPTEKEVMHGIYCLAGAVEPLFHRKPKTVYDVVEQRDEHSAARDRRVFEEPTIVPTNAHVPYQPQPGDKPSGQLTEIEKEQREWGEVGKVERTALPLLPPAKTKNIPYLRVYDLGDEGSGFIKSAIPNYDQLAAQVRADAQQRLATMQGGMKL